MWGKRQWVLQVGSESPMDHFLGVKHGWAQGSPYSLRKVVSVRGGNFCSFGLPPEPRDELERRNQPESLRSNWRQWKSSFINTYQFSGWAVLEK